MKEVKSIKLTPLSKEKEILLLLQQQGQCIYGEIIRQTKLSYSKGKEAIYSLVGKEYVRHVGHTTKIELAIELK